MQGLARTDTFRRTGSDTLQRTLTVAEVYTGSYHYDPVSAALLMKEPGKGDKTFTMFRALVAAKLNAANGCYAPCYVRRCIARADAWMEASGPVAGPGVKANSDAWQDEGECLYRCLDAYNNSGSS